MPSTPRLLPLATLRLGAGSDTLVPLIVLALAALLFAIFIYRRTEPQLTGVRRALVTALRSLAFLLLLCMLAEPILHQEKHVDIPPGVLVLTDNSGSMQIQGQDGVPRTEHAVRMRDQLLEALRGRGQGVRLWAADGSTRVQASTPVDRTSLPPGQTSAEGTDLPALLVSATQRHLEDNLAAIVLFSDGVTTTQRSPSLAGVRVPVFPIAVGDSVGPADVRLDRVRYPSLVYRGETVQIDAEVVADGVNAGSTTARLRGERGVVDSVRVQWTEGGGRVPIAFQLRADSLGLRGFSVEVAPPAGELLLQNNAVQIGIDVRKERLRLLYVERRPSWNFHFLARRAAGDRRFRLRGIYRVEDGWRIAGTDSTWTVPTTPEQVRGIDAWIFGSLDDLVELTRLGVPLAASAGAGAGILVLASDRGGTGTVVAGGLPRAVADLLPITLDSRAAWVQGSHRARATVLGKGHPVLAIPPELGNLDERLTALPPLWQVLYGARLAADADELLQAQAGGRSTPLLAIRKQGRGAVAAWLGQPLWSWSFWRLGENQSEDVYNALIGNLLYFLAEGGDRTRLRMVLPRQVLASGEDAQIRGFALDPRLQPDAASDVWLEWLAGEVAPDDSTARPTGRAPMQLDPRTPGGRSLAVPALPPGTYGLRLAMEEKSGRVESPWAQLVIDPYSVEFRRPRVDRAALARVAATTGGRLLSPSDLERWARELPLEPRQAVLTGRIDLWNSIWLLAPLLLALALEWALRKRWGLV